MAERWGRSSTSKPQPGADGLRRRSCTRLCARWDMSLCTRGQASCLWLFLFRPIDHIAGPVHRAMAMVLNAVQGRAGAAWHMGGHLGPISCGTHPYGHPSIWLRGVYVPFLCRHAVLPDPLHR